MSEEFERLAAKAIGGDAESARRLPDAAALFTEGIRVGKMRTYRGEQLRELGLEPSGKPDDGRRFRVTHVDETSITLEPMSDQIEPALDEHEWRNWTTGIVEPCGIPFAIGAACDAIAYSLDRNPAKLIALANAALPDDDPRKITRDRIKLMRDAGGSILSAHAEYCVGEECGCHDDMRALDAFAVALESYLPPETACPSIVTRG
jgi:hypothetical protein